jgi:hypothetical protein
MTGAMELEAVISKIRGLAKFTIDNGCSEQEAMNAARKMGELLEIYDLTMDKVFLDSQTCITYKHDTGSHNRSPVMFCVVSLAAYCQCRCWSTKSYVPEAGETHSFHCFFGLPSDVEMAKYLFEIIDKSVDLELMRYKQTVEYRINTTHGRKKNASFERAMARRIAQRLDEMRLERERNCETKKITCVSSVGQISSTSIVLLKRDKVEEEFGKLGMRLHKTTSYHHPDFTSSMAGRAAGNRVNLSRPLSGGKPIALLG